MRIKNWSWTYALGYVIVFIGIRAFYKRHKVAGSKNIPKNKPIIFASNHQNAFMDPVVIAVKLIKPTYYLVRADIFKKKIVAKIFYSINMLPIYRERDGVDTVQANEKVFNTCFEILSKNQPIIIFPEGNHGSLKNLRPLKKGFARIALGAEEKYGKEIDVQIVPVGINYSDHHNMGAELLINFGKPINASDWLKDGSGLDINVTTQHLQKEMSKLIIDIQKTEYYQFIHEMMIIFDEEIRYEYCSGKNDLLSKFNAQKIFIQKIEKWLSANQNESLNEKMHLFNSNIKKEGFRYWLFKKEKHKTSLNIIGLIILSPIFVYGVVNNYLPYTIPVKFVNRKIKDPQFQSSIKMAMGVLLFIIFWMIQTILVSTFLPNIWWAYYLVSLPIAGWLSYHYYLTLLKTKGKVAYNKLEKNHLLKLEFEFYKKIFQSIIQYQKDR
jgi:1-acyl-sn-glycerol-3-phosphate acyltransferase